MASCARRAASGEPAGDARLDGAKVIFAQVVRLVTAHVLAQRWREPSPLVALAAATSEGARREALETLQTSQPLNAIESALFDSPMLATVASTWPRDAWSETLGESIGRLAGDVLARTCEVDSPPAICDRFGRLYQDLLPGAARHALGEYYTPAWLAADVFDQVGYAASAGRRLLDPCCGSGVFLLEAIRRLRREDPTASAEAILARVAGFDVNPLAVLAARANCVLAVADLLAPGQVVTPPVHVRDVVLDPPTGETFDWIVGNPPWVAWDHLGEAYREATKPLWRRYGLFSLTGAQARHGGAKKDLSMLVLYAAADRYLADGGRLGFVITQTLLQSKGAGDGFRRFRLGPDGPPLRVRSVHDLVRVQPFSGAANWTATIAMEKGQPTEYPVEYVRWEPAVASAETPAEPSPSGRPAMVCRRCRARPIDPAHERSPWLVLPAELADALADRLGPSDYTAHLGANTGGANGGYWLELLGREGSYVRVRNLPGRGTRSVPEVTSPIEPELVYPLVRWADVAPYRAVPSAHLLLVQDVHSRRGLDESILDRDFPRTRAYLEPFREVLVARAAWRRYQQSAPFYSMYNVGPYTVAPWKVVWRRMARRITAARLGPVEDPILGLRPAVVQETCVQIAVDSPEEADYLAAMLNSAVVNLMVTAHSVEGGKGFGTPSMLDYLALARFDPEDARHRALAAAGAEAHARAADRGDLRPLERAIDELAAAEWGLDGCRLALVRSE